MRNVTQMQRRDGPLRVAVLGGGIAAAETVIALRDLAGERVSIDLVAPNPAMLLRPLAVAAPFGTEEVRAVPLRDLCADHGATLHEASVTHVDVPGHRIHTDRRETIEFDVAVVAAGARTRTAVPGALVFDGHSGIVELRTLLARMRQGEIGTVVFTVPAGVAWSLPVYELALMAAAATEGRSRIAIVTPERTPLERFGHVASVRIAALLERSGIDLVTGSAPVRLLPAGLETTTGLVSAHKVVTLPRLEGPRFPGVPSDRDGFIPVDEYQRVDGTANLYAAGDGVAFPVKQGGLAAQQADVAAAAIAARAGAPVTAQPFRPVLRALLLTGSLPLYLRGGGATDPEVSDAPLWHPVGKVAAKYLSPWLADRVRARLGTAAPFTDRSVPVHMHTADHEAALELALALADDEAEAGAPGRALAWLEAAESLHGTLPPEYVAKRHRWTLGTPDTALTGR